MKLFTGRAAQLETMNRVLTDSARQRAERVNELECELAKAAAEHSLEIQRLERELHAVRTEFATKDVPRLEAERAFYLRQMQEFEQYNRVLTETATNYSLDCQSKHRELAEAQGQLAALALEIASRSGELDFYRAQNAELEEHNRALTKAATKYARQLQGHYEFEETRSSLPSILIATIPKSGTVFTGQMLSRALDLDLVRLTVGSFPRYLFDLPRLVRFSGGGRIAVEHFDPSAENLQMLEAFVDRWVVHLRDPRSVLLSWVHNLNGLYRQRDTAPHHLFYVCPTPPKEYFDYSFSDQVDWNIEHFLPNAVQWTRAWLGTYDSGRYKIQLTTFDELKADQDEFLFKSLDFYNIPRDRFHRPEMDEVINAHLRVGSTNEWRECFTPEQLIRTRDLIGRDLLERFGWPLV